MVAEVENRRRLWLDDRYISSLHSSSNYNTDCIQTNISLIIVQMLLALIAVIKETIIGQMMDLTQKRRHQEA